MKRQWRALVFVPISVGALWLASRQVSWVDLQASLSRVSVYPLLLGLFFLGCAMMAKVERWALLLGRNGRTLRKPLWVALLVGYMGNVILPGRLGEVVRAYVLAERTTITMPQALSTVVVEKVLDIGTILAFLLVLSMMMPLAPWLSRAGLVGGIVFVGLCVVLGVVIMAGNGLLIWLECLRRRVPTRLADGPWWSWGRSFILGFASLRSASVAVRTIIWSILSWSLGGLVNLCVLWGFGIKPLLPAAVLTLVVTNLGMALPSAPGYIGMHHYLSTLALSAFAVPLDVALAYAIVVHALIFGSFALAGSLTLLLTGTGFGEIRHRAETAVEDVKETP